MTKVHILDEIKRTAAANSGVALGQQKFASETGIKKHDWFGKYWSRWSDALVEAGFHPNQLTPAHDKTDLLEKYAKLALELGRLPGPGDLRLKRRADLEFPSHSTFDARLGPKSVLVGQLLEFCRGRSGYQDVIRLCEAYVPRMRDVPDESEAGEQEIGFVYLIKSGRFHKIGKSNAAGRREYELAIQLPEKPATIHVIRTDDPAGIEAYWHKRFATKRKNGEWFALAAADVAAFKRRQFM